MVASLHSDEPMLGPLQVPGRQPMLPLRAKLQKVHVDPGTLDLGEFSGNTQKGECVSLLRDDSFSHQLQQRSTLKFLKLQSSWTELPGIHIDEQVDPVN